MELLVSGAALQRRTAEKLKCPFRVHGLLQKGAAFQCPAGDIGHHARDFLRLRPNLSARIAAVCEGNGVERIPKLCTDLHLALEAAAVIVTRVVHDGKVVDDG